MVAYSQLSSYRELFDLFPLHSFYIRIHEINSRMISIDQTSLQFLLQKSPACSIKTNNKNDASKNSCHKLKTKL